MKGLVPGKDLDSRYRLVRPLGQGGMGEVWLVLDRELDETVVAKVIPPDATADRVALLKHECKNARKLVHPHIVPIYDFHRGPEWSFITMAYVEGVDLDFGHPRSPDEIVSLLAPLAGALGYAHRQGVVHRDLKPSNVLVDSSGVPRLLDFGIAGLLAPKSSLVVRSGGSDSYASPERRRGAEAGIGDDIYAFGALAYRLFAGESYREGGSLPAAVPERLRSLVLRLLDPDPAKRPRSMDEVQRELEGERAEPRSVSVTPPPRAREVKPIVSEPGFARTETPVATGRVGLKTVVAFVVLLGMAVGVFALLPRWVQERQTASSGTSSTPPPVSPEPSPDPGAPSGDLESLARDKTLAERARTKAEGLRDELQAKSADRWGGEEYQNALAKLDEAETRMTSRDYRASAEAFDEASEGLAAVAARARAVLADTLTAGGKALASGSSTQAADLYRFALELDSESAAAKAGLARAAHLDEVLALVAEGESRETEGNLSEAAALYRKAIAIDPLTETAQRGLARVDARASERAFTAAMTEAVSALHRKDYARAREALDRASAIRPSAPEVASGRAEVEEGLRAQAIGAHRDRAAKLESSEDWRSAEKEFDAALALDGNLRFAREGKKRSATRALLAEKIDYQLGNPGRLSDENALREAALVLDEARAVSVPGPEHLARVEKLESLVDSDSTPVLVRIRSDELTDVMVYRVGRLGKFDERSLELRPGRYTVVGSREGYRDVRQELVVEAGRESKPLVVRCEEKI